ncbi:DUF599 domain-containing protein [Roseateles violae]|uniref:DUF599 domain-containing protein n=1 Tax=Roseateles violae TaxID=3058042 RepID=A0ABT8DSZ9_9BURK|nr:DUF599 domain-containing protein [Pelomonas sp. PFR6]MDN3920173.1 DUF599 domain-containing protein [Pelomonas sp. PFR6]
MDKLLTLLKFLPLVDWLALGLFFAGWIGYARFARQRALTQASVLGETNRERRRWMLQCTYREVRVIDGVVVQSLSTSPSFFASTTILIIGGLLALLGAGDQASGLVREIPFAARTSTLVFELKLVLLAGIFVYAFFRFTWSMRQYTFGALLVAAAPEAKQFDINPELSREAFADRAGRVVGLAAETFNDGLRAYYMAFAAVAWFFSPWALIAATTGVVYVLYQREFRSEVLEVLQKHGGAG